MTSATPSPDLLDLLARQIAGVLAKASWPGLRRLKVEAREGSIHLEGDVTTYFERQQGYQWVRRLAGGVPVEDRINVVSRRTRLGERGIFSR